MNTKMCVVMIETVLKCFRIETECKTLIDVVGIGFWSVLIDSWSRVIATICISRVNRGDASDSELLIHVQKSDVQPIGRLTDSESFCVGSRLIRVRDHHVYLPGK
jgi:hypothetical protein